MSLLAMLESKNLSKTLPSTQFPAILQYLLSSVGELYNMFIKCKFTNGVDPNTMYTVAAPDTIRILITVRL